MWARDAIQRMVRDGLSDKVTAEKGSFEKKVRPWSTWGKRSDSGDCRHNDPEVGGGLASLQSRKEAMWSIGVK